MTSNSAHQHIITPQDRKVLISGCVCVLIGFFLGSTVEPDPQGFGTHQQFGLPPCGFRVILGIPCPSCGGTTSVAHFVRGQWISSARANSAVFVLAGLALAYLPWSIISLKAGYMLGVRTPTNAILIIVFSLSLLAVFQWLWQIWFSLR